MQLFEKAGSFVLLNILFLVGCLPLITIGASKAGLHCGIRTWSNNETDESCVKAFFTGFRTGFIQISGTWGFLMIPIVLLVWALIWMLYDESISAPMSTWMAVIALVIFAFCQELIPFLHSHFECTAGQLLKNTWLVLLAFPIRSIVSGSLMLIPGVFFLADFRWFVALIPLWILGYYSFASWGYSLVMKKAINSLIELHNCSNNSL